MKRKKELNFDLNIISFIGLLAVCICFLLLTAIWVHIASLDIRQAIGKQSTNESEQNTLEETTIWAQMMKDGQVMLVLQNPPSNINKDMHSYRIQGLLNENGVLKPNYKYILSHLEMLMSQIPELSTGLIIPYAEAKYEDIITLMDQLKEAGLVSLGVLPLSI